MSLMFFVLVVTLVGNKYGIYDGAIVAACILSIESFIFEMSKQSKTKEK